MSQSLNNATPTSLVRQPRAQLLVNGAAVAGIISVQIVQTNFYQAAKFTIEAAANAAPTTARWWDINPPALVELQFATDAATFQTVFAGEAENITWDATRGTLSLDGRDLTQRLIQTKTQKAYQNKTSSEIAKLLAGEHGLKTVDANGNSTVTATTTLVGTYYHIDHVMISGAQFSHTVNEWDLLTDLAQHEGFDLWVQGNVLYFQRPGPTSSTPWVLKLTAGQTAGSFASANASRIQLMRSYTLAKDIQVDVHSWNSRAEKGFTKSVRAIGAKSASPFVSANQVGTDTQLYSYVFPNLSQDAALQRAQQILRTLSAHERVITFDAPGDLALTPRTPILVQGTSSSWDQTYFVDTITYNMSQREGFPMSVRAKNTSTRSTVVEL